MDTNKQKSKERKQNRNDRLQVPHHFFFFFAKGGGTFVNSRLLHCRRSTFKLGPTLKRADFLLEEQSLVLRVDPSEKGGENENYGIASPENLPIHLKLFKNVSMLYKFISGDDLYISFALTVRSGDDLYISVALTVRSCTICVVFTYVFFCE